MTDSPDTRTGPVFEPSPELMDANGHMNVGNYALVFDQALRHACRPLELRAQGLKVRTPESHIVYLHEVLLGQRLRTQLQALALDDTRLHLTVTLCDDATGRVAASYEALAVCTAIAGGAPAPWPAAARAVLQGWVARSAAEPPAVQAGRAVAIRRKPGGPDDAPPLAGNGAAVVAEMDAVDYPDAIVGPQHVDEDGEVMEGQLGPLVADGMERLSRGGFGMGSMNAQTLGQTAFVLESHTVVHRPLRLGDALHFEYVLLDVDAKRTHGITLARHREEGWLAATMEQIGTCVDVTTRRSAPWHPSLRARVEAIRALHAGRAAGLARSRAISFDR